MTAQAGENALVVAAHGRRGVLESAGRRLGFIIKGRRLKVACGDHVAYEVRPGSEDALVTRVEARSNVLARQQQRSHQGDVIAANLTQLVAVCAVTPEADLFLMDRYLCAAETMGCRPVVVCNKCDLGAPPANIVREYTPLGYPILSVSARSGTGLTELLALLEGQCSVLVGQSGVGKSSLVNALVPGVDVEVGALSAGQDIGTHTTTAVLMYRVAGDGRLVDAPGVRDFMPALNEAGSVDTGYAEIRGFASGCRFSNCRHDREPGCAVKQAVDAGKLSRRRYQSYLQLLAQVEETRQHP